MKNFFIFLILFFSACPAQSQGIINIPPNMYGIDATKSLIVINQPIATVNNAVAGIKGGVALGGNVYTFIEGKSTLLIGTSYLCKNSNNKSYTIYFTELPLVFINTPNTIVDAPKVWADFLSIEPNGTALTGSIGIEYKGGHTLSLPKKSFELSFYTSNLLTSKRDVNLFGLRKDSDWNLEAMFNESTRVQDKSAWEIWMKMHTLYYQTIEPSARAGIRHKYVEVFINGKYTGLFDVTEKLDRKQLQLKKYNAGIKGELYKADQWGSATTFSGFPSFDNTSLYWDGFEYKHPDEEINWSNLHSLIQFINTSTDSDFYANIGSKMKIDNAIDYYLFLNLMEAYDNTGKNTYLAKFNTSDPYIILPWDLDGSFGFYWDGSPINASNKLLSNTLFTRLFDTSKSGNFKNSMANRWNNLRNSGIFKKDSLIKHFQDNVNFLLKNGVYERESLIWPTFNYSPGYLKHIEVFIDQRLANLDILLNDCVSRIDAVKLIESPDGWTYYGPKNYTGDQLFFGIQHKPSGGNTSSFTTSIQLTKVCDSPTTFSSTNVAHKNGTFIGGYYWNVNIMSGVPNGFVNIRFFPSDSHNQELETTSQTFQLLSGSTHISSLIYFKTDGPLTPKKSMRSDGLGLNEGFLPLRVSSVGTFNNIAYVQFNNVKNLINSGGGAMRLVTSYNQTYPNYPNPNLTGGLRYNKNTDKFEGYNGMRWLSLH